MCDGGAVPAELVREWSLSNDADAATCPFRTGAKVRALQAEIRIATESVWALENLPLQWG